MSDKPETEFERSAGEQGGGNFISEFWYFLKRDKKWWLVPVLVILFLFSALMMLSGTALAPFIYTLF